MDVFIERERDVPKKKIYIFLIDMVFWYYFDILDQKNKPNLLTNKSVM